MDCPICKNTVMITIELNEVEIDYCLACRGIWLDKGELEILLGDSNQASEVLDSFKKPQNCPENQRKCPICGKKMEKVCVGNSQDILIDRCCQGDGLWFDSGELKDIFSLNNSEQMAKIRDLLDDMLGKNTENS